MHIRNIILLNDYFYGLETNLKCFYTVSIKNLLEKLDGKIDKIIYGPNEKQKYSYLLMNMPYFFPNIKIERQEVGLFFISFYSENFKIELSRLNHQVNQNNDFFISVERLNSKRASCKSNFDLDYKLVKGKRRIQYFCGEDIYNEKKLVKLIKMIHHL